MSERMIHGRGRVDAEIVVIGEAPGRREMVAGLPFVGPSGKLQEQWIRGASLDPGMIRYENVYPTLPPGGVIDALPWEELKRWQEDCLARLDDCTGARVIVPTGNVALGTLLGVNHHQANITQRRGSIYSWEQASGRRVKVIPVIHPAAVLREEGERGVESGQQTKKSYEFRCRMDWGKIAREVMNDDPVPVRELVVQPSPEDFYWIVRTFLALPERKMAFDIETNPALGKMLCISFSCGNNYAVSVPWSKQYKEDIRLLLESSMPKVTQNGHYDCYWLYQEGFSVNEWEHDTMAKSCLLWPGEPHSLAYLTSILTREPWYKGGDEDTGEKHWKADSLQPDRWHALMEYNARDSVITWEVNEAEDLLLHEKGWMDVYEREYQALFIPILETMLHGMRVDRYELQEAYQEAISRAQVSLDQASRAAGTNLFTFNTQVQEACWRVITGTWDRDDPVVAKTLKRAKGDEAKYVAQVEAKGISNTVLARVLYDEMKMPVQRSRKTKNVTTDEAHLLKLRAKYKDGEKFPAGMVLIESVLGYREQKKQSETLNPERLDKDGRFRASYSFRPSTGRLSSSSNPKGTGGNAQNVDRDLRRPFKPDSGCVLIEVDLSQAEARVVYCLTRNKKLIEIAHTKPSQFDVHTFLATLFFGVDLDKVTKAERTPSKNIGHGSHYDLHTTKLSEMMLKQNYDISPNRCGQMQQKYWDFTEGAIQDWQRRTRMEGLTNRKLTNSWGRVIEFPYDKAGDDWYRRLYAWRPQSDIARHLNRGWVLFHGLIDGVRVNLQLHDALIFSVPFGLAYNAVRSLVNILEEPHDYYGEMLSIPAEVKVGMAWSKGVEFKELPEREEFEWRVREMMEKE